MVHTNLQPHRWGHEKVIRVTGQKMYRRKQGFLENKGLMLKCLQYLIESNRNSINQDTVVKS